MTVENVAAKLVALKAWKSAYTSHWAIKPRGVAFPYLVCVEPGETHAVTAHVRLVAGWQTFHDYMRTLLDPDFGFYMAPMEISHFELLVLPDDTSKLLRYDTGYIPRELNAREKELCAKMLWEVYGVLMRLEADEKLALAYADQNAFFARVETAAGVWKDEPMAIPTPRPHVEQVSFGKKLLADAKDLPMRTDVVWEMDLRILKNTVTRETRPRFLYTLLATEAKTGARVFQDMVSVSPEGGLRALWEGMAPRVLMHMIEHHVVPGELRVCSQRVFRLMRPLCLELPLKLTHMSKLEHLDAALKA